MVNLLSWHALVLPLVIFGCAPRLALRIIVRAWHPEDLRREELLAEFYSVPRLERPLWVAEQLEAAVCEGLQKRFAWAITGRLIYRWHLGSGGEMNRLHPDTFWIPDDEEKAALEPGDHVRLIFEMSEDWGRKRWGERMWVNVVSVERRRIIGTLRNTPAGIPKLYPDQTIKFSRDDIIDIVFDPDPDECICRSCESKPTHSHEN